MEEEFRNAAQHWGGTGSQSEKDKESGTGQPWAPLGTPPLTYHVIWRQSPWPCVTSMTASIIGDPTKPSQKSEDRVRRCAGKTLVWGQHGAGAPSPLTRNGSPRVIDRWHLASQVALVIKNPPASAGGTGNVGSIPESGRSSGEGNGNPHLPGKFQVQRSLAGYCQWGHNWVKFGCKIPDIYNFHKCSSPPFPTSGLAKWWPDIYLDARLLHTSLHSTWQSAFWNSSL